MLVRVVLVCLSQSLLLQLLLGTWCLQLFHMAESSLCFQVLLVISRGLELAGLDPAYWSMLLTLLALVT